MIDFVDLVDDLEKKVDLHICGTPSESDASEYGAMVISMRRLGRMAFRSDFSMISLENAEMSLMAVI